jgi:hypothetical protein
MGINNAPPHWGAARRILFRFAFVYLVLYVGGRFVPGYEALWDTAVPWVGKQLFQVTIPARHVTGSGDTTFDYVQVFCFGVLAAAAAGVWTLLDRKRLHYGRLHEGLRVGVRFFLAMQMIAYGAVKVIPVQMPSPSLDRLLQPIGDASPMGLLWTFMGASASYSIFTGGAEMLGGLLLTARRTTLLGALVCVGVLGNVVMLNFCYDVPVKLFSSHLLAMAVFLIAPDLRRLADLLLFNRRVEPVASRPLFARKWLNGAALALRTVLVVGWTALQLGGAYWGHVNYGNRAPRSPLHGVWDVEEFTVDGKVRPPLVTDEARWRRVIFDNPEVLAVQLMSDARQRYLLELRAGERTLALSRWDDPAWKATLTFKEPEPGRLLLEGTFDGRTVRAKLRRRDDSKFLLTGRGFHWVNEYPFNR